MLKKSDLNRESLSSYHSTSNLPFISKLIERLTKAQLTEHLDADSLFNSHQSAHMKHHSTETVLPSIHHHTVQAISHQTFTGLCLMDLSVAFDIIDHSIILKRLSHWFGYRDTVLAWIASYLRSRTFSISTNDSVSGAFPVSYDVLQGSVLGPLLFLLYTTPLSLYFIRIWKTSMKPCLHSPMPIIPHPSGRLQTCALLNSTKTEFLLIGGTQQLPVIRVHLNLLLILV